MKSHVFAMAIIEAVELSTTPIERVNSSFIIDSIDNGILSVRLKIRKVKDKKIKREKIDTTAWNVIYNLYFK